MYIRWIRLVFIAVPAMCGILATAIVEVKINSSHYIHEAREEFISVSIGCLHIIHHWRNLNFTNPRVVVVMSGLSPTIIRLGGTACDRVVFKEVVPDNNNTNSTIILAGADWDKLVKLADTTNSTILYDVNVMLRTPDLKQWDPTNFIKFLDYNARHNYGRLVFELGNEPNDFKRLYGRGVRAEQLAADFGLMRRIIRRYPLYKDSLIVGPDVTNPHIGEGNSRQPDPATYLHAFLKADSSAVDSVTWHQYYMKASDATVSHFINRSLMDDYQKEIDIVSSVVASVSGLTSTPLWMGETSAAYGGGGENVTNTYVAGFMWMDKLGLAAQAGYDVVIRQSLFGGCNGLLDPELNPTPDYWLSLLYKRLVGRRALQMSYSAGDLRVYASCTNLNHA